jgi:VanZ family protein
MVTCAWGVCLLYLGLAARLPIVGDVDSSEFSKWGHALGTMLFAALVYLLLAGRRGRTRRRTALLAFGIAIAGGALLEVLQAISGSRDPAIVDVVVDAAGAAVAVIVLSMTPVSPRTWTRLISGATAVMLVVVVPAVLFATPGEPAKSCDPIRVSARSEAEGQSPTTGAAPLAEYAFDEGSGRRAEGSGASQPPPLELVGRRTTWIDGGGLRFSGGAARSATSASGIVRAVRASGQLTIAASVRPARLDMTGPSRIVTISSGTEKSQVNVHLGVEGRDLSVRLRATCGEFTWTTVPNVFTSTRRTVDVTVTFRDGVERVFVDGAPEAAWRIRGTLRNWDERSPLVVGNEATLDRPLVGDVFGVTIDDRVSSGEDVG